MLFRDAGAMRCGDEVVCAAASRLRWAGQKRRACPSPRHDTCHTPLPSPCSRASKRGSPLVARHRELMRRRCCGPPGLPHVRPPLSQSSLLSLRCARRCLPARPACCSSCTAMPRCEGNGEGRVGGAHSSGACSPPSGLSPQMSSPACCPASFCLSNSVYLNPSTRLRSVA